MENAFPRNAVGRSGFPERPTKTLARTVARSQSLTTEMSGASTAFMPTTW
jgi:hypothetical protein